MKFPQSRGKAALSHFALSALVVLALAAIMWFIWYPAPLFQAVGGVEIFLILIGCDVVLGPLLTFVVFNPPKKSLKFDLAVIVAIQLCALIYGTFSLWQGRPVYVVSLGHRFDVIQANDIPDENLPAGGGALPFFGPKWVGFSMPSDPKEREVVFNSSLGGLDYGHYPKYHAPIESMSATMLAKSQSIKHLRELNPDRTSEIDGWFKARNLSPERFKYLGLKARSRDFTVIIDGETAAVVGIAPFVPWKQ
jgi:hypothetical protein